MEEVVREEEDERLQLQRSRRFATVTRRKVAAQQVIYNRRGSLDEDNPIDLVGAASSP